MADRAVAFHSARIAAVGLCIAVVVGDLPRHRMPGTRRAFEQLKQKRKKRRR